MTVSHHLMLDLETMAETSNAAIVSITLQPFELYEDKRGKINNFNFSYNVDLESCTDLDMDITAGTVMWWLKQSDAARQAITVNPLSISNAIGWMRNHIKEYYSSNHIGINIDYRGVSSDLLLWSHGKEFDIPILENAFKKTKSTPFWKFRNTRDTRTIFDLAGINFDRDYKKGDVHTSKQDCINQANAVIDAYAKLRGIT